MRESFYNKLNTLTKYPSIPTYHKTDDKGMLIDEVNVRFPSDRKVSITEKIDGTNARIIYFEGNKYIGSRENLLTRVGDAIYNPQDSVVDTLIDEHFTYPLGSGITVWYCEVYGGRITRNSSAYTNDKRRTGYRFFDAARIYIDREEIDGKTLEQLSGLRESSAVDWLTASEFSRTNAFIDRGVPFIGNRWHGEFDNISLDEAYVFLRTFAGDKTQCPICGEPGKPEGIVIRTEDRSHIAKLKYQDYERAIRFREENK